MAPDWFLEPPILFLLKHRCPLLTPFPTMPPLSHVVCTTPCQTVRHVRVLSRPKPPGARASENRTCSLQPGPARAATPTPTEPHPQMPSAPVAAVLSTFPPPWPGSTRPGPHWATTPAAPPLCRASRPPLGLAAEPPAPGSPSQPARPRRRPAASAAPSPHRAVPGALFASGALRFLTHRSLQPGVGRTQRLQGRGLQEPLEIREIRGSLVHGCSAAPRAPRACAPCAPPTAARPAHGRLEAPPPPSPPPGPAPGDWAVSAPGPGRELEREGAPAKGCSAAGPGPPERGRTEGGRNGERPGAGEDQGGYGKRSDR